MRRIRNAVVLAAFIVGLGSITTPAHARPKCSQYPTFIQPIICRILES